MDELLDLTEKTPRIFETGPVGLVDGQITIPIPKLAAEMPPLSPGRAAHGTRTGIAIAPPLVPVRAPRTTVAPPPIPPAALRAPVIAPPIAPPTASASVEVELTPPASVEVDLTSQPKIELAEYTPPSVLPPLPAPSASWLSQTWPSTQPGVAIQSQPMQAWPMQRQPMQPMQPWPTQPHSMQPWPTETAPMQAPQAWPTQPPPMQAPVQYAIAPMMADHFDLRSTSWFTRMSRGFTGRHFAVVAIVAVALVSVLYVAFSGDHAAPATSVAAAQPTSAPIVATAPAAAPVVAPAPVPVHVAAVAPTAPSPIVAPEPVVAPARPARATVPITSVPVGAVVTLVTDGNAQVVGKTPVTVSIDPAQSYDVVLSVRGQPTQIRHVDATTHAIAVDLTPAPTHAAPHAIVAPAPAHHAVAPKPVRVAAAPPSTGSPIMGGILAVTTKPPCEIVVDGKVTHLMTPQRSMSLPSGRHVITLINVPQKIRKTIAVQIDARKPTTVAQDFTKH